MPFVRVSRDKRGYETIYLVHTTQRRGRPAAPRVLYVFRTPPGVKVGRDPFDVEIRRTLEAQNPSVEFDWDRLSDIPAPPPDVEHWRERRRLEKAARQARKAEELEESADSDDAGAEADPEGPALRPTEHEEVRASGGGDVEAEGPPVASAAFGSAAQHRAPTSPGGEVAPPGHSGKRRRRRRGGRKPAVPAVGPPASGEPTVPADPSPDGDSGAGGEDVA